MRRFFRNPVRLVPLGFLVPILLGTGLLMTRWSTIEHQRPPLVTALFTATSAVSVTGMAINDTPNYWSGAGLVVITVLTQLGGLGILTAAALVILVVSRQLGLRNRLLVQAETAEFGIGDVGRLLRRIAITVFACEAVMTAVVAGRLWWAYDYPPGRALWSGVFHAVQAFNNVVSRSTPRVCWPSTVIRGCRCLWRSGPSSAGWGFPPCSRPPGNGASRLAGRWPPS